MKKTTQKGVCLLLLLGSMLGYSQETSETYKALYDARMQLTVGSATYNPQTGLDSYLQMAQQGNARAMNGLGLCYSKGIGVKQNEQEAINWFQKSAEKGYARAWYNLGLLYLAKDSTTENLDKTMIYLKKSATAGYSPAYQKWGEIVMKGHGTEQDYSLAINIFQQGAEKGNAACIYSLGYLHYKGFGFPQDYAKAIEHFEIAAIKRNTAAMYMLGLCHRNGYGVSIDLEKSKYWLNRSANSGFKDSEVELADPEAENANPNQNKTISSTIPEVTTITNADAPENYAKVKQQAIKENISGNYSGQLLRYDWSGKNTISKTPIQVQLIQNDKSLTGVWRETAGDTCQFTAKIQDDAIVFEDSKIDRTEHFYKDTIVTYNFKEARLQLLQTDESIFIVGNLQLYNIKENQNEKPMYLILERKQETITEIPELISSVVIHPNPVVSDFNLSFNLAQNADVSMTIYNLTGSPLYFEQWNNLTAGQQTKTLALNAPAGYYLLRLTYGNQIKTTLLIKK